MSETTEDQTHDLPATAPQAAPPALSQAELDWRLMERKAVALSRAGDAIPKAYRNRPGDILASWTLASELGVGPMAALRGIFVVNGRPSLSGDLMLAIARGAGVRVSETIEGQGDKLTAKCTATLKTGEEIERTFSVADATQAGLWGSNDVWKKYPARMLAMRARSYALRDGIPHLLSGCYVEGEIDQMRDVTPTEGG